jgi:hypothetical protein
MSAANFTVAGDNGNDAGFRAWGSAVSAALAALGFVQTADTGQINWTTVTRPLAINTAQGYEVWRFADTLQATAPIFVKLEYGSGVSAIVTPGLWVTVGTGSNGAGTITGSDIAGVTGAVTARQQVAVSGAVAAPATLSYATTDADKSVLQLFLWPNATSSQQGLYLLVERTRDWSGQPTGDGFYGLSAAPNTIKQIAVSYSPNSITNSGNWNSSQVLYSNNVAVKTNIVNNVCYPTPIPLGYGPRYQAPSKFLLYVSAGDLPTAATLSLTVYGESHTFYSAGAGSAVNGWGVWSSTVGQVAGSFLCRID